MNVMNVMNVWKSATFMPYPTEMKELLNVMNVSPKYFAQHRVFTLSALGLRMNKMNEMNVGERYKAKRSPIKPMKQKGRVNVVNVVAEVFLHAAHANRQK
jgi:hypothetical protein